MTKNKSFMLLIEPFEARLLLEALLKFRKDLPIEWTERDVDTLMFNISIHLGYNVVKDLVPEAYKICFPEGPPKMGKWWLK